MRTLLMLLLAVLCGAAETTTTSTPAHDERLIANERIRVAVSTLRGSIRRVELLQSRAIRLPTHLARLTPNLPPAEGPLPVLRAFMANGNHNWMVGDGTGFDSTPWTVTEHRPEASADQPAAIALSFTAANGLAWTVRYWLPTGAMAVRCEVVAANRGQVPARFAMQVVPLTGIHTDYHPGETYYQCVFTHAGGSGGGITNHGLPKVPTPQAPAANDLQLGGGLDYVGLKSRFFAGWWMPQAPAAGAAPAVAAQPPQGLDSMVQGAAAPAAGNAGIPADWTAMARGFSGYDGGQAFIVISYASSEIAPGATWARSWDIGIASMTKQDLAAVGATEQQIRYTDGFYRFFKLLANALTWVLDLLALAVHHYGVAVILLTVLIKAALFRTTWKQQESMLKMQKIGPELKYLQEQYKNNRQMQAQKQMELFKKHGVNPLGGCLPLFIQLPIFIALFQAFSHSADLRGTSFLWVSDLTLPDQVLGVPIALLDNWVLSLNPLPLIYIGVSAWMGFSQPMPANADPQQEMMYKMMRWMPVVFGLIFYNMPSGLVLYFTVQAVISTLELKFIRRRLGM